MAAARHARATLPSGKQVMVHALPLPQLGSAAAVCVVMLMDVIWHLFRSCAIVHPHIIIPRSLLRTPSALCITADLANGGSLFLMVRRGAPAGLPAAAAAFLFQQLTVTAQFGLRHGLWLHLLPPSKLLISWNEKGMPIVKVNAIGYTWPRTEGDPNEEAPQAADQDAHMHEAGHAEATGSCSTPTSPADQGRIRATTLMPPQMVRALAAGQPHVVAEPAVAAACTVWALAVCLFFLRRGRWPFSPEQIRQWAVTPAAEWSDDVLLAPAATGSAGERGTGDPGADPVTRGMDAFEEAVYRCGRESPADFARLCPTVDDLMACPWWRQGLPDGALDMTESYTAKTEAWAASGEYAAVKGELRTLLAQAGSGGLQMQGGLPGVEGRLAALQLGAPLRGPRCRPAPNDPLRRP